MAHIDKDKIPYYLDTSEEAPMEGRKIAFKSDIDKIPPADVVEVVRCKDCTYCVHGYPVKAIGEEALEGWYCRIRKRNMRSDDFCSYGKRKEAEG